jgi:hypothetical protein
MLLCHYRTPKILLASTFLLITVRLSETTCRMNVSIHDIHSIIYFLLWNDTIEKTLHIYSLLYNLVSFSLVPCVTCVPNFENNFRNFTSLPASLSVQHARTHTHTNELLSKVQFLGDRSWAPRSEFVYSGRTRSQMWASYMTKAVQ